MCYCFNSQCEPVLPLALPTLPRKMTHNLLPSGSLFPSVTHVVSLVWIPTLTIRIQSRWIPTRSRHCATDSIRLSLSLPRQPHLDAFSKSTISRATTLLSLTTTLTAYLSGTEQPKTAGLMDFLTTSTTALNISDLDRPLIEAKTSLSAPRSHHPSMFLCQLGSSSRYC